MFIKPKAKPTNPDMLFSSSSQTHLEKTQVSPHHPLSIIHPIQFNPKKYLSQLGGSC